MYVTNVFALQRREGKGFDMGQQSLSGGYIKGYL
jgi:hypothetical protein